MVTITALALAVVAAAPANAPIAITSCRVVTTAVLASVEVEEAVRVTYKNTSKVTAKAVYFQVVINGKTLTVVDKGRFAPGITISHQLDTTNLATVTQSHLPTSCKVAAVQFVNGTNWVSPTAQL